MLYLKCSVETTAGRETTPLDNPLFPLEMENLSTILEKATVPGTTETYSGVHSCLQVAKREGYTHVRVYNPGYRHETMAQCIALRWGSDDFVMLKETPLVSENGSNEYWSLLSIDELAAIVVSELLADAEESN